MESSRPGPLARSAYALALVAYVALAAHTYRQLLQVPGCVYGCDVYFHKGIVESLANGLNVFRDPTQQGELAYYPWLAHLLGAAVSLVFSMPAAQATIAVGFSIGVLSSVVAVAFARRIFDFTWQHYMVGVVPLVLQAFHPLGLFSGPVALGLVCSLAYHALARKGAWLILTFAALASLTHVSAGILAYAMVVAYFTDSLVTGATGNAGGFWRANAAWIAVAVAVPLLFYGPLLVHYGLATPNAYQAYAGRATTDTPFTILGRALSVIGDWFYLIGLPGLVHAWFHRRRIVRVEALFLATYLAMAALFLARGEYLLADRFAAYLPGLGMLNIMLLFDGLRRLSAPVMLRVGATGLLLCVLGVQVARANYMFFQDRWIRLGFEMNPLAPVEAVLRSLPRGTVILSSPETSFALFALAGTPTVLFRRTHGNPFVDYDARHADVANLLYTRDEAIVRGLLARYRIHAIFIDRVTLSEPLVVPLPLRHRLDPRVPAVPGPFRFDPAVPDGISEPRLLIPFRLDGAVQAMMSVESILDSRRQLVGLLLRPKE